MIYYQSYFSHGTELIFQLFSSAVKLNIQTLRWCALLGCLFPVRCERLVLGIVGAEILL